MAFVNQVLQMSVYQQLLFISTFAIIMANTVSETIFTFSIAKATDDEDKPSGLFIAFLFWLIVGLVGSTVIPYAWLYLDHKGNTTFLKLMQILAHFICYVGTYQLFKRATLCAMLAFQKSTLSEQWAKHFLTKLFLTICVLLTFIPYIINFRLHNFYNTNLVCPNFILGCLLVIVAIGIGIIPFIKKSSAEKTEAHS